MNKIPLKDIVYVAGLLVTAGIAYGSLSTRLAAQERAIAEYKPVPVQLATINQKLDDLIDVVRRLEYRSRAH